MGEQSIPDLLGQLQHAVDRARADRRAVIVNYDDRRGHFRLDLPDIGNHSGCHVIGADLGSTLHLTTAGAHLTPAQARAIADALTWWADRKEGEAVAHV